MLVKKPSGLHDRMQPYARFKDPAPRTMSVLMQGPFHQPTATEEPATKDGRAIASLPREL